MGGHGEEGCEDWSAVGIGTQGCDTCSFSQKPGLGTWDGSEFA